MPNEYKQLSVHHETPAFWRVTFDQAPTNLVDFDTLWELQADEVLTIAPPRPAARIAATSCLTSSHTARTLVAITRSKSSTVS